MSGSHCSFILLNVNQYLWVCSNMFNNNNYYCYCTPGHYSLISVHWAIEYYTAITILWREEGIELQNIKMQTDAKNSNSFYSNHWRRGC